VIDRLVGITASMTAAPMALCLGRGLFCILYVCIF
jgi:hypothetical protein